MTSSFSNSRRVCVQEHTPLHPLSAPMQATLTHRLLITELLLLLLLPWIREL